MSDTDISEDTLVRDTPSLLNILLKDQTTKQEENAFMTITLTKKQEAKMLEAVTRIAQDALYVETLERRWNDSLDFYDIAVWNIQEALEQAYKAGRASVK